MTHPLLIHGGVDKMFTSSNYVHSQFAKDLKYATAWMKIAPPPQKTFISVYCIAVRGHCGPSQCEIFSIARKKFEKSIKKVQNIEKC